MNNNIIIIALILFSIFLISCATKKNKSDDISSATLRETYFNEGIIDATSKTAIVLFSFSENNTKKIANELASVFGADILFPDMVTPELLSKYDLLGFGSGIFDQKHHKRILEAAEMLSDCKGKKVFLFSTSGISRRIVIDNNIEDPHDALRAILKKKECNVVGEFNCPGLNKNSFLFLFGGINKGRPNLNDLENARKFAKSLLIYSL